MDERLIVPIGIEAWILPWIAARMGKRFNHPGDLLHFGCGIRWSTLAFDFDYSFDRPPVPGADLEPKWLIGLSYSLKRPKLGRQPRITAPATDKKPSPSANPPSSAAPLRPVQQDSIPKTIQTQPQVPDGSSADTAAESGVSSSPQEPELQPQPLKMPLDSLAPPSLPAQPADSTNRQ